MSRDYSYLFDLYGEVHYDQYGKALRGGIRRGVRGMTSVTAYEAYSAGEDSVIIRNTCGGSRGDIVISNSPSELLDFLRYSSGQTVRIFWDLDESIAPVLKTFPTDILERLVAFDEDLTYCGNQLYYLPDRMFRVGRTRYYSIKHFWSTDEPPPESLAELQTKADELNKTLSDCGMPDFSKLTSPIAIFEQTELGKKYYADIPKGYEIPEDSYEAIQYASRCDRREWVSAYQIGGWSAGAIFDYDLSGAYPSCASDLLDLREFEFWKSDVMGAKEQTACYGFLCGRLYLNPDAEYIHCSPIVNNTERLPGNPAGDFGDDYYLTLDELRFVADNGLGEFTMSSGWFMSPREGSYPSRPFQPIMEYLYQKRGGSGLASSVMKGVANQFIGKLIETRVDGSYGEIRNDIYHALILARARIKVAQFLMDNEVKPDELVCVQTDGVRLTREITLLDHNGMGSWRCNGSSPTIVASPYKVYVDNKKPGHLTYEHIVQMISDHPLSQYYGRSVKYRITLRRAIQMEDISLVGIEDDLPAHLDLNVIVREQNRLFAKFPHTGQALINNKYQSKPIVL